MKRLAVAGRAASEGMNAVPWAERFRAGASDTGSIANAPSIGRWNNANN
jgi:hypothetical protein